MAQTRSVRSCFVVYGRDPSRWSIGREYVVESTDFLGEYEHHRDGRGFVIHLGPVCIGVGRFDRGLAPELIEEIEKKAVWLDVEAGDIGRWRGGLEAEAEELGFDYEVSRQAGEEDAVDVEHGAEALG